jgi:hypothetical protein
LTLDEATRLAPLAAAIIGSVAAETGAASATFACVQMRLARRNAVLQALQSFDKTANDREIALGSAETEAGRQHAFYEFMNFLELYAGICNRKLLSGLAHELVRDRLVDSLIVIERALGWREAINKAIFHTDTFSELRRFLNKNRVTVSARRVAAEERAKNINTRIV